MGKKWRLVTIFVLAFALAIGGWGVLHPTPFLPFDNPPGGMRLAHAEGTGTGCDACHTTAATIADYTGCTQCHPLPSLPALVTPGSDVAFDAHHDLIGDVRFTATVYCQNNECHNSTDTDSRFVVRPVITPQDVGHSYCWGQCHDNVKVTVPTCTTCHFGETWADGSHYSHTLVNSKSWSTAMACGDCHDELNYPNFSDGQNLTNTTICDSCHSPAGAYDGVDSTGSSVGAKDNWLTKIYDSSHLIKTGLERWCAGCHDSAVGGFRDIVGSGFYTTGHGKAYITALQPFPNKECSACHDTTTTDYPLKAAFVSDWLWVSDAATELALCFTCHDYERYYNGSGDNTFDAHKKHVKGEEASCYSCHAVSHTKDDPTVTVEVNNMIKWGPNSLITAIEGTFDGNGRCWTNQDLAPGCHGGGAKKYGTIP